jgi:hypothetical protein
MTATEDTRTVAADSDDGEQTVEHSVTVTAHECSPDRTVFTERDNTDGWIATDTTVDPYRQR